MRRLFSTRVSENALGFALLILRVGVGSQMLMHGYSKLQNFNAGAAKFNSFFGLSPTVSFALLVFAEFFCAAFIILGLFTRLAAIPLIIAMSVALFMAHKGLFYGEGETAGTFLVVFLTLLFSGAGKFSVDRAIGK